EEVQRRPEGTDPRQPIWDINSAAADYFRSLLWDDEHGRAARDYLSLRGVAREVADRFGLGFAPRDTSAMRGHFNALGIEDARLLQAGLLVQRDEGGELRPRFRNRLIFPILDIAGNTAGFGGRLLGPGEPKYLNSSESPVFSKARLLYGMHMARHVIRRDERAMVVEGYFDVVRLVTAGFDWVVAPLGTALTEQQAALIRRYTKNVYLLYDSDQAGLKATFRAGDELLRHGASVQVVTLPDGEDPDSFVDKHGAAGLSSQLSQAMDVFERKVQLLERAGWFGDLRGKRRALDRLLPTVRAATDPITRDMYIMRASEAAGVSREVLQREVDEAGDSRDHRPADDDERRPLPPPDTFAGALARNVRPRRGRPGDAAFQHERDLVRILLQHRSNVEGVGEQVGPDDLHDHALQTIYAAILAAPPDASLEEVAAMVPESARFLLDELIAEPLGEGFDVTSALAGSVNRIRGAPLQRELVELQRQLSIATEAEKDAIIAELKRKSQELSALGIRRYKGFSLDNNHSREGA
ncbi:MAG TPA: toprim domain-containing protein, partial [Gemmatimonadaceae bacterium]|nr:toprim domain-containing protein [Gemmatimonadaceae bacterium]